MQVINPPGWTRPKGYSNGIVANGRMVFIAGQVGWNEKEVFETDDFTAQVKQALNNITAIVKEAGGKPEHIVRMTWFIASREEYMACQSALGKAYREVIGRHYPVMSVVEVSAFIEPGAKVEIEATAVIPNNKLNEQIDI